MMVVTVTIILQTSPQNSELSVGEYYESGLPQWIFCGKQFMLINMSSMPFRVLGYASPFCKNVWQLSPKPSKPGIISWSSYTYTELFTNSVLMPWVPAQIEKCSSKIKHVYCLYLYLACGINFYGTNIASPSFTV